MRNLEVLLTALIYFYDGRRICYCENEEAAAVEDNSNTFSGRRANVLNLSYE